MTDRLNERDGIRLMEYLDGTLSPAEREQVEAWLAVDSRAREMLEQHRALWALLGEADAPQPARASAEFRTRALRNAREQERTAVSGTRAWLRPQVTTLIAASLLIGLVLFAWWDAADRGTLDETDRIVVGNLDLLENLDFLQQHAEALDFAIGATVLPDFPDEPAAPAPMEAPAAAEAGK